MRGDPFLHDGDGALGGFTPGDMGGDREPGVVVDELEDHAFATTGQHILGAVELPARVRRRINEPPNEARGFFRGSSRATPASRKIRANDAIAGTGVMPSARIFS